MSKSEPAARGQGASKSAASLWRPLVARLRGALDPATRIETRLRAEADLLNLSYDALFTWELDGAITFWNRGAEELYGYSPDEAVGRISHDLLHTWHPLGIDQLVDALHSTGRWDGELRHTTKDGREIFVDSRHQVIERGGSRVVLETNRDVTERRRAERSARFLADASAVLSRSLDVATTLDALARLAVPALADWCTIDFVTADGGMERALVAHADPGKAPVAQQLWHRWQRSTERAAHGVASVAQTGRAEVFPEITDDLLAAAFPDAEFRESVKATGLRSAMIVPLLTRDRVLGALSLIAAESGRRFGRDDLPLAEEFGYRAAVAVDNARAHEAEQQQRQAAEQAAHRMGRLQAVTAALAAAATPDEVAKAVFEHAGMLLGASRAYIALPSADRQWLDMVAPIGLPPDVERHWRRVPLQPELPSSAVFLSGVPLYAESGEALLDRYPAMRDAAVPSPAGARAMLPLRAGEGMLGVLTFHFPEPHAFSEEERTFLQTLAHQCAQALDRAQLHEAEQAQRRAAEEAARRVTRLQTVTAALSEAVSPQDVASVVLAQGIGALDAQAGAVYVMSPDGASLDMLQHVLYPDDVARSRHRVALSARAASAEAARTGDAIYIDSPDEVVARYPALRGQTHPLPGSRAFVPMVVRGRTIGTLVFIFKEARRFDAGARDFIQALARQCAQALDRARLYAHEHRVAATLQQALLPTALPALPGIQIDAAYRAGSPSADVGGDWYDAVRLPDGRVMLAIGDVVGRGLDAAVTMGQIRQAIRAGALDDHPPAEALALAGRLLRLAPADQGMTTAIVGVLDPLVSTFTYASAGHPAPLLVTGGRAEVLPAGGLPLGFLEERTAPSHTISIAPGSLLVLYTDGLIESRRDPVAGLAALRAAVERQWKRRPAAPAQQILGEAALGGGADDVAVVTVAMDAAPLERVELTVPAEPDSLRVVRQGLQRLAKSLAVDEPQALALAVAAGEAVNNAIEHAYGAAPGSISIRAWRDRGEVKVEVADQGRWRPERPQTSGGRGLGVIRALTDQFELTTGTSGTTVRFALPLALASADAGAPPPPQPAAPRDSGITPTQNGAVREAPWHPGGPVALRRLDGIVLVEVTGDVDLGVLGQFTRALDRAAAEAQGPLIVSLPASAYFDSQGIRALFRIAKRLEISRRTLVLVVPPGSPLRHLLNLVEFSSIFPMFDSVDQAAAALRSKRPG